MRSGNSSPKKYIMSNGKPESKRIVIIGAGITGLATCLALKQQDETLDIVIHEQNSTYYDYNHVILWRSAINSLLELGLGHRLSRISNPLSFMNTHIVNSNVGNSFSVKDLQNVGMLSVRKCDLIRMLLTALVDPSFANSNIYSNKPPNNDDVVGIDADLATPNWFETQQFEQLLPFIKYNSRLESIRFLASNGNISCLFSNGTQENAYMLLGKVI